MEETLSPVHEAVQELLPPEQRGKKRRASLHRNEANGFTHAEMRAKIVRMRTREKMSRKAIAEKLNISVPKVKWYLTWAEERGIKRVKGADVHDVPPTTTPARITRPARPIPGSVISAISSTGRSRLAFTADDPQIQRKAFELRKHAVPFDEIATILSGEFKTKLAVETVRGAAFNYLRYLNDQESADTELERRMQLEQLDQMIRALTPGATGRNICGSSTGEDVKYEAVDRMIKLLAAKSKLMGLDAPRKIDLEIRLQQLSVSAGYDYEELKEIATEVYTEYERTRALGSGT